MYGRRYSRARAFRRSRRSYARRPMRRRVTRRRPVRRSMTRTRTRVVRRRL